MSCYARAVEDLSEAMVSLRWIDEDGAIIQVLTSKKSVTGLLTAYGPTSAPGRHCPARYQDRPSRVQPITLASGP